MRNSFKPHYTPGDHALYNDIVGLTTPLRQFTGFLMTEDQLGATWRAMAIVGGINISHYRGQLHRFLEGAQQKFDLSAKVHDMFGNNGLVH